MKTIVHHGAVTGELRLGDEREALAGEECDTLCADPPYGDETHDGHNGGEVGASSGYDGAERQAIEYDPWTPERVHEFVASWAPRTRGWFLAFTGHELTSVWREAFRAAGRVTFAPTWIVHPNSVRFSGDGPASPGVYLMVSRPSSRAFLDRKWGSIPGVFSARRGVVPPGLAKAYPGGKSIGLLAQVLRHYSRPGDVVADPTAGVATTIAAAIQMGRFGLGSELDPSAFELGSIVLRTVAEQPPLPFHAAALPPQQTGLPL